MNEGTTTKMLVRPEGVSGGPVLSASLRDEPLHQAHAPATAGARLVHRRQAAAERARQSYHKKKSDPAAWAAYRARKRVTQTAWNKKNQDVIRERNNLRARRERARWDEPRRAIERARCRASYQRHREKRNAESKEWRQANKPAVAAIKKKWRMQNREKFNAQNRARYQRHKESRRAVLSAWRKKDTARLGNTYVRHRLSSRTRISRGYWPESFVQLKRAELQLKRLWQNQKT